MKRLNDNFVSDAYATNPAGLRSMGARDYNKATQAVKQVLDTRQNIISYGNALEMGWNSLAPGFQNEISGKTKDKTERMQLAAKADKKIRESLDKLNKMKEELPQLEREARMWLSNLSDKVRKTIVGHDKV